MGLDPGDDVVPQGPAPVTLAYVAPAPKRWHVGTLTYARGGLVALFFWLLWGDFAFFLKERSVPPTLQILLRTFGASALVSGLLLGSLPQVIAMLLGPVVSYRSDRHRGRWGRRIPFLLMPTPLAVVAMVGLAFSPILGRGLYGLIGQRFLSESGCIILCLGVSWALFELASITCNAVFGALVNDVVPRPVIGRFFGLFRAMSLIAGMLFHYKMLGVAQDHYVAIFLGIGALYGVSFTVMCLKVKEGQYPPPKVGDHTAQGALDRLFAAIRIYIRDCFTKPYYLWFFLSFALANIAFEPINLYSLWFATSVKMSDATYGKWSAVQLGLSLLQAFPLGWLADKIHPIRVTMIALAMYAVSTLMAFFFVRGAASFAAAHVICGTISGIWLTATAPLGPALLPRAKFATYASALGICVALGRMVCAPIIGRMLDVFNPSRQIALYDFHYIYIWASVFITLSLLVMLVVYRHFMTYGGPRGYVAPE